MRSFMIKLLLLSFGSTFITAYSEHATNKDIFDIPEAPILPPLNLNGLRYIHNAEAKSEQVTGTSDNETKHESGESKPEIQSLDEKKRRTKTYGLSLKSGEGYAWNDINGSPDVYYKDNKIGNEEHKEFNNAAEEITRPNHNSGNEQSRPVDNLNLGNDHSTPIEDQNPGNGYSRPNGNLNLESDHPRPTDIQISGNHYTNPIDNLSLESNHPRPIHNQNLGNEYSRPIDNRFSENDNSKPIDTEIFESDHSRPIDNLNFGNHPPGPNLNLSADNSNIEDSKEDEVSHENSWNTPETFQRILNDDKFWGWLVEWIEFYYDIVSKYIENNIKEEVTKQLSIKRYYNREFDKNRIDNDANTIKIKIISDERNEINRDKTSINYEEIVKRLVNEFKNALNANNHDENHRGINLIINREEDKEGTRLEDTHHYSTHKEDAEQENKEDLKSRKYYKEIFGNYHGHKEIITTADKGRVELPIEGDSHLVEKGRPGNYSGGANYEVRGENIYGNSVGNDEVTNIYIFHPNEFNDAVKHLIYSYSKNKELNKRNDDTGIYDSGADPKSVDNPKRFNEKNVDDEKTQYNTNTNNGQFLRDDENIKNIVNVEDTIDVRSFGDSVQQ